MSIIDDIRGAALRWVTESEDDVTPEAMGEALEKAGYAIRQNTNMAADPTAEPPRAMFHDPYSILDWGGWRQRPSSLTYESLRQMSMQATPIAAIIQLRVNQISQFCRPQQRNYDKGYRIVLRDRRDKKTMTPAERQMATEIERMIETTGYLLPGERPTHRDSFRTFVKKSVRDVLTYDQWCHPAGTVVQMADGTLRPIEAVQVGDRVVTHKGRVRRVTHVLSRPYTGRMVRIRYRGQSIEATEGHPLFVSQDPHLRSHPLEGEDVRAWVAAGEVSAGQYLTSPDVQPFGERSDITPEMARVLGLYTGDGHRSGMSAVWTFHEDESDLVAAVQAVFPDAIVDPYADRAAVSVRVNGEGEWFASRCGEAGAKRVPHAILHSCAAVRRSYLQGLLEADGHFHPSGAVLSTTSSALRGGVTLLAAMDGMCLSWSETANAAHGWSPCWQGRFSGEAYRCFAREVGIPITEPERPREPTLHGAGYHHLRINRVETYEVEDFQVFNLEVEEDHSYIANGVASHNCFEKQRDMRGRPSRFICLDGSSIRPAVSDVEHMRPEEHRERVSHVQIYENTVVAEFTNDDLAWCIMNPRADIRVNGFGLSPIEQIIQLVTAWLFGFQYNQKFFTQGSAIKGLINIKGAIPDKQMRAFRRMWYTMVSGVGNAWRTPILNAEDIQWQSMHSSNREMEFSAWMDWLTKLICAVYGVDPVEINFQFGNTGQSGSLNEASQEDKITESKDKGLRPLVDHLTDNLNQHIVWELCPDFEFTFAGLDAKAESAERKARMDESSAFKTIDEVRAEVDLPPLPDGQGAMIRDSNWVQYNKADDQGMGDGMGDDGSNGGDLLGDDSGDDLPDDDLLAQDDSDDGPEEDDDLLAASFKEWREQLRKSHRAEEEVDAAIARGQHPLAPYR